MRIVAIADTHLYHHDLRSLPAGDILIHAGDLLRSGSLEELEIAAPWLAGLDFAHKIVVAGNHDWCFQRDRRAAEALLGPDVTYLEDSEVAIAGVRFWGSPWQPVFRNWAFNLPRGNALAEKWRLIPDAIDVLITHGPPRGIGDWEGEDGREGCDDLRTAVERARPRLHLFGHIHQDGGCWRIGETCFANVTTWEGMRAATVIDYDSTTREIERVEAPPRK
jgi:Icc-related predicted phosphoesterase